MRTLTIFEDDGSEVASVSVAGNTTLTFARTSREWSTVTRWIRQGFYLDEGKEDFAKLEPCDPRFLPTLASRAHEHGFSTELREEDEGG